MAGNGNPIVGIIIVVAIIVVCVVIFLIWGLNAAANNCWEDEASGDKFCDWLITINISNIPVTNTVDLFLPELCAGFRESIEKEGEIWGHIHPVVSSDFNQDLFFWTWNGSFYVRINMTENSGGSNYDSSVLASSMAGTKVRDGLQSELSKRSVWGMGTSTVSA